MSIQNHKIAQNKLKLKLGFYHFILAVAFILLTLDLTGFIRL